jgi:hypothetical protein
VFDAFVSRITPAGATLGPSALGELTMERWTLSAAAALL